MSEEKFPENMSQDIKHFINTFCEFHKAFPSENQHIFGQVYEQIEKAEKRKKDYIQGDKGQEEIWVFERSGVRVYKRVFHPGPGEGPVGVDFAIYKEMKPSKVGATAVQVKRNRGRSFFEFLQRDLNQLSKLAQFWGSAYYLMVDETIQPPLYCFLTVNEVDSLIHQVGGLPPVRIENQEVRNHCRGLDNFYGLFYSCSRGSSYLPSDYNANVISYIQKTRRILVELSAKRKNSQVMSKMDEKPRDDLDGRIKGLIDSL
jgi:hypothetical protein